MPLIDYNQHLSYDMNKIIEIEYIWITFSYAYNW